MFDWFKRRKRPVTRLRSDDCAVSGAESLAIAPHTLFDTSSSSDTTRASSPCEVGSFDTGGFDGGGDCGGGGGE